MVLEELDRFKKDQNENGRNARHFARIVDSLRQKGSLMKGVELENGSTLFIGNVTSHSDHPDSSDFDIKINDNLILKSAQELVSQSQHVVLITKDINLRLKADALGIESEDYEASNITLEELYSGQRNIELAEELLNEFEEKRFLPEEHVKENHLWPNEYIQMFAKDNPGFKKLGRYCRKKRGIVPLVKKRDGVWGIYPKNIEQQFAIDALLNDEIALVSLVGKAGTGKTLLAIAAGLEGTINQETYSRLLVSRPIIPMGRDLGFLPGDVNEKLGPWMQPIFDNIDYLFGNKKGVPKNDSWEELINQGLLHVEPLTYIRGRSLPAQYMIVDEAQNLSPHEVKTIITRAGEGTKIILTGDCEQIDSPYLDSLNNGLAYCIDRLKDEEVVSHAVLRVGERSLLSEIASQKL